MAASLLAARAWTLRLPGANDGPESHAKRERILAGQQAAGAPSAPGIAVCGRRLLHRRPSDAS